MLLFIVLETSPILFQIGPPKKLAFSYTYVLKSHNLATHDFLGSVHGKNGGQQVAAQLRFDLLPILSVRVDFVYSGTDLLNTKSVITKQIFLFLATPASASAREFFRGFSFVSPNIWIICYWFDRKLNNCWNKIN